jgi:Flp pilus assembly protein TadD
MKKLLLLILIFVTSRSFSQDYGNKADALKLCTAIQTRSFTSDIKAENTLEKILNVIGASKRFVLQPCNNINNVVAISYKGIRYILYDVNFMNTINNGNNWGNLFILAHEVGHHINGHSLDLVLYSSKTVKTITLDQSRKQELEADEFAGFILAKLGGDVLEVNKVINNISSNKDDSYSTHPNATKRLNAIQIGFNKALGNNEVVYTNKTDFNLANEYFYAAYEKDESNDFKGAISDYTKSIEINPNDSDAYFNRAISKSKLNDLKGALTDCTKAIQLKPNDGDYYLNRASYKAKLNDLKGAIADCTKAIEINPNYSDYYFNRGVFKRKSNDLKGAISDYSKSIEINPNDSKAYVNRGYSKYFLNDKNGACLDWTKASELGYSEAQANIKKYCN